jgi:hypothetical protein
MVRVFVWTAAGKQSWGHASLEVNGGTPMGVTYVSWWPRSDHRSKALSLGGDLFCATAFTDRSFFDDVRGEDGRRPSHTVDLPGEDPHRVGLNETAIKAWWSQLRSTGKAKWCTLAPNCSTITAFALTVGGGARFSDMWNRANLIWSPSSVVDYARAIQSGIVSAQQRPGSHAPGQLDGGLPPGGL